MWLGAIVSSLCSSSRKGSQRVNYTLIHGASVSDYAGRFCSRGQKGSIDSAGNPQRCGAMSVASSVVLAQARAASEGRPRQTLMYEINSYIAPQKLSVAHYWA